jgi:hypothetical protein
MRTILAQVAVGGLERYLEIIIIVSALIAIVLVVLQGFGFKWPPWVWQIFGIVVLALVGILAIRLLTSI